MKKNIYLLLVLLLTVSFSNGQTRTLNTNDAIGTLPGVFNVNTNGAATYYIPIKLPKGRAGFSPTLGLSYNSQKQNGILGMGWSLNGVSVISRVGTNLYNDSCKSAIRFDNSDKFSLNGQRLIPVNSSLTEYRTEKESFSKIIVHGANVHDPDWFEVRTKDGRIIEYGRDENNNNSAMKAQGNTEKLIWRVNRVEDRQGNYIDYYYSSDYESGEITKITYTGNLKNSASPSYEVDFSYSGRNDINRFYISGDSINQNHLLSTITVRYNGQTVQSYQITYDQTVLYPRIKSISTSDGNGNAMNPTVFSYNNDPINSSVVSSTNVNQSGADAKYITGDFNGDGKTDIACVYYNPNNGDTLYTSWSVFYSTGDGANFTQTQVNEGVLPTNFKYFVVGDFNGDGKEDLVSPGLNYYTYYLSTGNSFTKIVTGRIIAFNPIYKSGDINGNGKDELIAISLNSGTGKLWDYELDSSNNMVDLFGYKSSSWGDSYDFTYTTANSDPVRLADFTGSGKTDLMINTQSGEGDLLEYDAITKSIKEVGTCSYLFSTTNQTNYLGDFNGDGITDALINANGQWTVKYFNGKNGWSTGPSFSSNIPPTTSTGEITSYDNYHIILADFNGDGKTDILQVYTKTVSVYASGGGLLQNPTNYTYTGWNVYYSTGLGFKETEYTPISGKFTVNSDGSQFFDSNGDGKSEWLISKGAYGTSLELGMLNSNENLYDIQQISNGLGSNINITYQRLGKSNAYTKGNDATYPLFDVEPPICVVTKTQQDNDLGGNFEKDYQYEGFVGNHLGIPGPGFQKITVTDHVSNTQTVTNYSILDDNGYYYLKYPSNITQYALNSDGTVNTSEKIVEKTNTVGIKNTITENSYIYYPVITQSVTKLWDNGSSDTFISMETDTQPLDKIDNYGNSLESTVTLSSNEQGNVYRKTTYQSSFSQNMDPADWIVGRPDYPIVTNHYVNDSKDNIVRTNYTYYNSGQQSWPLVSKKEVIPNNNSKYKNELAFEYDVYGNIIKKTESVPDLSVVSNPPLIGRETDYGYDESTYAGRFLTSVTKHNGSTSFTTSYQYNQADGTLSKSTDANGLSTNYEYGHFGQLIKVVNPDGSSTTTQLEWASTGSVSNLAPQNAVYDLCTTNPNHSKQVVFFDKLGRKVRMIRTGLTNTQWIGTDKVYDGRGFLKMVSQPYFSGNIPNQSDASQWTTYTRNTLNNKVTGVAYPTHTITIAHSGLQTSITNNATGVTKTTIYNIAGKPVSVTDPTGTINYNYYSGGQLKSTEADGNITTITYDDAGRKQKIVNPNSGTTQYLYSNFGQLLSQTDNRGNKYQMSYDELGRIKDRTLTNTSAITTYTYNDVSGTNGLGALKSIQGPNNISYQYSYDNLGRISTKSETIDGSTYTSQYAYDSIGELQQETYPSGYPVQYVYSNSGALTQVKDGNNGTVLWKANTIDRRGQLTGFTLGNGLTTTKQFDDLSGLPKSIVTQSAAGYKVQDLSSSFNNATGNLTSRTDNLYNLTESFGYDNMLHSRLTSWHVENQTPFSAGLANDGNILTKSDVTASGGRYVYGNTSNPNAVTQIIQPTAMFKQDATPQNITYTAFNKINAIQQTDTINGQAHKFQYSLTYGPDFSRKKSVFMKDSVTQDTKYYIGDYEVKTDARGHQRKMNYLYGGDGLFAIYVQNNGADTMYYIQKNYLGSYYCVTNASGNIVTLDGQQQVYSFGPWGRRRNATTWTYSNVPKTFLFDRGFTGHEYLDAFGLINMNGRCYDPGLGRFLSVDPVIQDMSNTQSFNSYSYALNNPLKYTDPSGYMSTVDMVTDAWNATPDGQNSSWVVDGGVLYRAANSMYGGGGGGGGTTGGPLNTQQQIVVIYNKQGTPYLYNTTTGQVWSNEQSSFVDAFTVLGDQMTYDVKGNFYTYFLPEPEIKAKAGKEYKEESIFENGFHQATTPLAGIGVFGGYFYTLLIKTYFAGNQRYAYISASEFAAEAEATGDKLHYGGEVELIVNGQVMSRQIFRDPDNIAGYYPEKYSALGYVNMQLPSLDNNVQLKITLTYTAYGPEGHAGPSAPFIFYKNYQY